MLKKIIKNPHKEIKNILLHYICKYKNDNIFEEKPSVKFFIGLFFIGLSFIVGWGIPIFSIYKAFTLKRYGFFAALGGAAYILSYGIFAIGMLLTAKKNMYFISVILSKRIYKYLRDPLENKILFFIFLIIAIGLVLFISHTIGFVVFILIFAFTQIIIILGLIIPDNHILNRSIAGKKLYRYSKNIVSKNIIFRFDDGVNEIYTPVILKILKEKNIKAIFSLTGENIKQNKGIVKNIFDEGHIIANHTYTHPYLFSLLPYKKLKDEITKTNDIIKKCTSIKPIFFASPMGHNNIFLKYILRKENMIPLGWDINSYDTMNVKNRSKKILIKIQRHKKPLILLFHDGIYKNTKPDRDDTIKTLKDIIDIFF